MGRLEAGIEFVIGGVTLLVCAYQVGPADGRDSGNKVTIGEAIEAAQCADTQGYSIPCSGQGRLAPLVWADTVRATGPLRLARRCRVPQDQRAQPKNLTVQARNGYYAEPR